MNIHANGASATRPSEPAERRRVGPRPGAVRRRRTAVLAALTTLATGAATLLAAGPASAATTPVQMIPSGLTAPDGGVMLTGAALDPATGAPVKHLWLPDHLNGVCRVDIVGGVATENHQTCMLLAGGSAIKPTQLSFDPATNMLYSADITQKAGNAIWRFHYDPSADGGQGALDPFASTQIDGGCIPSGTGVGQGTAPDATALDASGNLYVGFKRSPTIFKITNPSGSPTCADVSQVAQSGDGRKILALAMDGNNLFQANGNGVAVVQNAPSCTGGCSSVSFAAGVISTPFSVAVDPVSNVLYVGDTSSVWAISLSASNLPNSNPVLFSSGFSFAFGLAVDPTGTTAGEVPNVWVTDDPSNGLTPGSGRLWEIPSVPIPDTQAPTVPTGLKATAVSATQINLSWTASTDNVGVAGYNVFRDGTQVATVTTGTTFSDTGLAPISTHSYTVSAFDAVPNTSAPSAAVSATTLDTQPPSTPTGLTATTASTSEIDLSWTASTDNVGVTAYHVFRDGTQVATVTAGTTFADTGLAGSSTHSYTVTALDAAGNESAASAAASATTLTPIDGSAPTVPTGLSATAVSTSQINVSWTASTDNVGVAGYHVYRDGTQIATVTAGTSFSDTGLAAGSSHSYTVDAFDAVPNTSARSAAVSATTQSGTTATVPGAPIIGTATAGVTTDTVISATAKWTAPISTGGSPLTSFRVTAHRVGTTTTVVQTKAAVAGKTTPYTLKVSGLVSGASYFFTVQAVNRVGAGAASAKSNTVVAR